MDEWKEELYHHGILGMKWGKRNGPPYPLGSGDHSVSEKKAGWRNSLSGNVDPIKRKRQANVERNKQEKASYEKSLNTQKKGLSDKQKKALKIGLAVVGTALVAYGAYRLGTSPAVKSLIDSGKSKALSSLGLGGSSEGFIEGIGRIKKPETLAQSLQKINPHLGESDLGYHMNCGNCVISLEARLRGNAAEAAYNERGMTIPGLAAYFKGLKSESFCNPQISIPNFKDSDILSSGKSFAQFFADRGRQVHSEVLKEIGNAYPSGSRGALFIPGTFGSHWVSWIKDSSGKVAILNPQDPSADLIKDWFGQYRYHKNNINLMMTAIRLDDLEFNPDNIGEVIIKSGSKVTRTSYDHLRVIGKNFVSKYTSL